MSDKADVLKKFDNPKLIDVVKNYKQYGYDDTLRNTALSILKERGVDEEFLNMTGNLRNSKFEFAEDLYKSYKINSKIAFIFYMVSILIFFCVFLPFEGDTFISVLITLRIICMLGYILFFILSLMKQNEFYKTIGKDAGNILGYIIFGMPFYVIMYFIYQKQMAEEIKLIK